MATHKSRIRLYAALLLVNLIVFSLSAHVNSFTGFFYVADLLPFSMSIITVSLIGATLLGDLRKSNLNPVLSRPAVELLWLGFLGFFWLFTVAFSTSRWKNVQAADCGTIPSNAKLSSVSVWCKEIQALRSFVWVEWLLVIGSLGWLWLQTSRESARGNRHAWSTSFARSSKNPSAHLSFDNARPVSHAASSFHTGEDGSRYSSRSQPFPTDFDKESAEHYNNTHDEYAPRHQHSTSGGSGFGQGRQPHQYQYPSSGQEYQHGQPYGHSDNQYVQYGQQNHYGQYNQPQGYGYGYQQQMPQEPPQPAQGGYHFDGYGQAR